MNWNAKDRSEIALNTIWASTEKESKILKKASRRNTRNPCFPFP